METVLSTLIVFILCCACVTLVLMLLKQGDVNDHTFKRLSEDLTSVKGELSLLKAQAEENRSTLDGVYRAISAQENEHQDLLMSITQVQSAQRDLRLMLKSWEAAEPLSLSEQTSQAQEHRPDRHLDRRPDQRPEHGLRTAILSTEEDPFSLDIRQPANSGEPL